MCVCVCVCVCTHMCATLYTTLLFIHLSIDEHLVCFHILATMFTSGISPLLQIVTSLLFTEDALTIISGLVYFQLTHNFCLSEEFFMSLSILSDNLIGRYSRL